MKTSENIAHIAVALSVFQSQVEQPKKTADNPYFKSKYVTLEAVIAAVKQGIAETGLSYLQIPQSQEGAIGIKTVLLHEKGEFIEFDTFVLPLEKNSAQSAGGALTYARRYSLAAAFGIASDTDTDGMELVEVAGRHKNGLSNQRKSRPLISNKQLAELSVKAQQLASKNNSDVSKVYQALQITKVTSLSQDEATQRIDTLRGWLKEQSNGTTADV